MTETALEPILLDVDMSVEEFDLDMDARVEQIVVEGAQLPEGGEIGDILMKVSSDNYDAAWSKPLFVSLVDDILTFQEG